MSVEQHLFALRITLIAHLVVLWLSVGLIATQSHPVLALLTLCGAVVATNERNRIASLALRIERDLALTSRILV